MSDINIFEVASRKALRFMTTKGELSTELLWGIPLESSGGFDLDSIARGLNTELKSLATESFVKKTPHPQEAVLSLKLEIVKHIIGVKLAEETAAKKKAAARVERNKLLEILASKEDEALKSMSKDDIMKRLEELDG